MPDLAPELAQNPVHLAGDVLRLAVRASGGSIFTKMKAATNPLCRPSGWTCLWRTLGNLSVLNRMARVA